MPFDIDRDWLFADMTIAGAINPVGDMPDLPRALRAMALGQGRQRLHREIGCTLGACDDAELATAGRIVVLFHGRLDAVTEPGLDQAGHTASDIVAQAYRRWGAEFPLRLVGDFACAVWDGQARRLLLARDALGMQPLHFWRSGEEVFFVTEPRGLLTHSQVERQIDERWIARWLAMLPQNDTGTINRGIERVLPGHVAIFDGSGARQHRYWRPEELPPIRLACDEDYADALRTLLDEAIRCRIGAARTVGCQLSAGLDSSSVAALAARQLSARGLPLIALTAVPVPDFDGSEVPRNRIWNEGPLANLVAEAYPNVEHVLVPNEGSLFDVLDQVDGSSGLPARNPSNQTWIDAIGRAARQRGVDVMLVGSMGNMSISYDGFGFLMNLARRGRCLALARHLLALRRKGQSWAMLCNRTIAPVLPAAIRRPLRRLFNRPEMSLKQFSALSGAFARQQGVLDEAVSMAGNVGNTALARKEVRLAAIGRIDPAMAYRGMRRRFGFTTVDPTADRRVLEFCLAIPPEQFLLRGEDRSLIRRAMQGILPDPVRLERRRGLQSADWSRHLTSARAEIAAEIDRLQRSSLASACLDLPRLRRLLDDWPQGAAPGEGWHDSGVVHDYQLALLRGLATGRFLRRFEGGND